jgi:hypothetical protein
VARILFDGDRMRFWLAVAILVAVGIGQAGESIDSIFNRLAKVDQFAFGPTGYAGVISQGEKDYKSVLSRQSAMADFEKLYLVGNPQAKCYALVGLHKLNPSRFKELSESLRNSRGEVVRQSGCIVYHESFAAILKRIEAGQY